MDIIKKLVNFSPETLNQKIEFLVNKSIDTRKIVVNGTTSIDNKIKVLVDDMYSFNLYSNCLYLMELKATDKELKKKYQELNEFLKQHNIKYNTDINLLKAILELYAKTENEDKKFFLLKTIKSMEKYGTCSEHHKKILAITQNIEHTENIINNILEKPLKINIDRNKIDAESESIVSSVYPDKQNHIYIDKSKYYYLVKKISDKNIRSYLEKEYMKRYNELLPAISKLISSRKVYAEYIGYDSFYRFCSNKTDEDTENLKIMLKDLNEKLDFQLKGSLETIKDLTGQNNKLLVSDIIYGLDKFFPDIKLKPIDIFETVFVCIQNYFKIKFVQSKITPLNRDCNPIEIYDSKDKLRGYLFMDLLKNNKNVKQLSLLRLTNGYGENLPVLYLMGAYNDMEKPICTYSEVVTVFREFGFIISNIFNHTPLGIAEDDIELINFLPNLMEYIAYNPQVILTLVKDKNYRKRILKARENELLINLKLKCISVLFDSIIHSSNEFLDINNKANTLSNSNIVCSNLLLNLYKRVFADVFSKLTDIVDCDLGFILPSVIHNTINGQQGLIYGNIISSILAYNTYEYINSEKNIKSLYELLENKTYSYKKNLIKFITTIKTDYYKNFLTGCLKIKDTSLDNYFDDEQTEAHPQTEENIY